LFSTITQQELKQQVAQLLEQDPALHAMSLAEQLKVTEGEVVLSFPESMVSHLR